ncbi:carbohydrate-binding module family 18 protein, partial [Piromyces sp. E2]
MKFLNLIAGAVALFSAVSASPNTYAKDRCGKDYGECESGYCCSKYNWCGKTNDHCLIENGCQSEFGVCKNGKTTITSTVTKKTSTTRVVVPSNSNNSGGEVDWAGFRFSPGGVKKNYGEIPNGNKWISIVNSMAKHFDGANPTVVMIVSENSKNTRTRFGFKKPKNQSETEYMKFGDNDLFEDILSTFDRNNVNVWLQVEPGNNDLVKLAKIVFDQYGHHSCVKGFGIDLEW